MDPETWIELCEEGESIVLDPEFDSVRTYLACATLPTNGAALVVHAGADTMWIQRASEGYFLFIQCADGDLVATRPRHGHEGEAFVLDAGSKVWFPYWAVISSEMAFRVADAFWNGARGQGEATWIPYYEVPSRIEY